MGERLRNAPETPRPRAAQRAQEPPKIERDAASVQLRLAIAKAGLGLELAAPAQLGPVSVTELAVVFTGLRFPLDVSGGVARFRHRRGHLRRMVIEAPVAALARWAAPRLAGILGPKPPEVSLLARRDGVTVTLVEPVDVLDERALPPVLVFDVAMDTSDDDVRLAVHDARGDSLPSPATALALRAMEAALGTLAAREGACFRIVGAAGRLVRALMPDAGARVPSTDAVRWSATLADSEGFILHATHEGVQAESSEESTRAREAAAVTKEADDARIAGDLVRARKLDLAALDRAPKHPEVCRRIAEIDAHSGGRAEAALTTLADAQHAGSPKLGTLPGALQQETGDVDGAIAAFIRVGEAEPSPALGARGYERAAMLVRDHLDALLWLDLGLARAPGSPHLRWTRLSRRLASGRVREALADVEHLEALATGPKQKYAVWQRAGRAWAHAGLRVEAGELFERALRYAPDDVDALAGLGTALVAEGRAARGVALLGRALDLAARLPKDTSTIAIELATALATKLGDKPGAVAKVRTVPDGVPESLAARGLEGRWRAELGDLAGAALAFARMREAAASLVETGVHGERAEAGAWLAEAAKFEREVRRDLAAAQRHLAIAIRLLPHDEALGAAYRHVCAEIAPAAPAPKIAPKIEEPELDEDEAAARVEELTRKLQGDPTQDAIVDELAHLLTRLGRSLELLALLTARLEDAPAERRAELLPKQRSVLAKLEEDARAAGRSMEADLFRDARKALD